LTYLVPIKHRKSQLWKTCRQRLSNFFIIRKLPDLDASLFKYLIMVSSIFRVSKCTDVTRVLCARFSIIQEELLQLSLTSWFTVHFWTVKADTWKLNYVRYTAAFYVLRSYQFQHWHLQNHSNNIVHIHNTFTF